MAAVNLSPLPLSDRPLRRFTQLFVGLALYGASMGLMVRAGMGLDPWDVLHEGLTNRIGLSFGTITALTGAVVLLAWLPLRQMPGIGTVANVVVIALAVDATLALLPELHGLPLQIFAMLASVVINGFACAVYIGARLGPGPRDGLMTGITARTGWSIRLVRTGIELSVLALGWLLGGTVGIGTVVYALAMGPVVQAFLPSVALRAPTRVQTPS
ncbi:YitT family protein [Allokutzneria sp. NRRL B-24872]|uniref:membrane protein YczE n=1 Tax=Allokutzneria sp. NRRL B-24872 TaxID=1137961 RepID=UPI00143D70FF|nr:hypothetical protein [Allokutzneria sp. NRRL B-24872]